MGVLFYVFINKSIKNRGDKKQFTIEIWSYEYYHKLKKNLLIQNYYLQFYVYLSICKEEMKVIKINIEFEIKIKSKLLIFYIRN